MLAWYAPDSARTGGSMNATCSRRSLLLGGFAALTAPAMPASARNQKLPVVPRVGFLLGAGYPELLEAFHGELARLGYVPGHNIIIVQRLGRPNTDDTARHAAELAAMDLDLIVAAALPHALLVRAANPRMPMVVGTAAGLVCNGFGRSM